MLDRPLRKIVDPWLDAPAAWLSSKGISANMVSVAGLVFTLIAGSAISQGQSLVGLGFILASRLADGLDGCVARRSQPSDVGGFLDFTFDLVFYGGIPFAFAIADPKVLLPVCFLLYSFMLTSGSFLAFAVISAKRGVTTDQDRRKSFFYSVGLMEGSETILFFTLLCLFPEYFAVLTWTFAALCWLTFALRMATGVIVFRQPARPFDQT